MSFGHFAEFLRCPVYTNPYFGGVPLKSVTAEPKMLTLNSNKRRSNLDLFFKIVSNRFCPTQGFTSVVKVNRVFIIFALSLYTRVVNLGTTTKLC